MDEEPRPNRSIVYDERFDRELAEIEPDFGRADECLSGLEWVLIDPYDRRQWIGPTRLAGPKSTKDRASAKRLFD